MKFLLLFFGFLAIPTILTAQSQEVLPPDYIRTIQFRGATELSGAPVIKLGQGFTFEFDDLIGDEADYYYKISYYNYDWTPSNIARNEYMKGFDNNRIRNYKNSFNTLQIYTHYQLQIPNHDTQALKISGNYMLEVYDSDDQIVFSKPFIIYEDITAIETEVRQSRDLKYLNTNQVVNFSIHSGENFMIRNPDQNLHVFIYQNENLKKSITGLKPQYRTGTKLIYKYDEETSFNGGNEYLFFDSKDVHSTANNIQKTVLDDIYNLYLFPTASRFDKPYTYNPDINGKFKIQTVHGSDPKIESEYVWVHFALKDDQNLPKGSKIHIFGGFNDYTIDESTTLAYNPDSDLYEGKFLLKQGFYNYKYVLENGNGQINESFFSGDSDKTENDYTVLAYYREPGARYDRIIGRGKANSENISN